MNGSHPVGWIVYSLFTVGWFVFLKVLNYRLHQALGSDPLPDPNETPTDTNETGADTKTSTDCRAGDAGASDDSESGAVVPSADGKETDAIITTETVSCENDAVDSSHTADADVRTEDIPIDEASHTVLSDETVVRTVDEDAYVKEEDHDSCQNSASTLNETATRSDTPTYTPTIELLTISREIEQPNSVLKVCSIIIFLC